MSLIRIISASLCMTVAVLSAAGAVSAGEKVAGKTYYTAANIWYEKPDRIESTNFIRDKFIPVGTQVTIKEVYDTVTHDVTSSALDQDHFIRFVDKGGAGYTMVFVKRHAAPKETVWTLFERYFSAEDPLAPGGPFSALSADEQANVKRGRIASGMSKKAVLMAYGHPPGHKTPSLESNNWRYWQSRFKTLAIKFENGVVVLPESEKTGREGTVEERLKQIEALKQKGLITEKEYEEKRANILKDL